MLSNVSEHNAMEDYVRTNYTNQFFSSLFANQITYQGFLNGFYITGYDLTASATGGALPFVTPMVRMGKK